MRRLGANVNRLRGKNVFSFCPSAVWKRKKSRRSGIAGCQKTYGELERAEALSIFNRARRRVRRVRGDFCGGKSHFPEQKSFPCRFCARGFRRNPSKICKAENPKGFQVSPKAKLPTAKSKILTRHRGGGSGGGACSPVHQLVKKTFLTSWWAGEQAPPPGAAPQISNLSRGSFAKGKT